MSATLTRGPVTTALLAELGGIGPVGDGVLPLRGAGAGWNGEPNAPGSRFVPFTVLITLTAGRSSGPFADSQADWQLPYMLESFAVSRAQCDKHADLARTALGALTHQRLTLGDASYTVQQVRIDSIGPIARVMVSDPPFYGQQDGFTIWITKEFT